MAVGNTYRVLRQAACAEVQRLWGEWRVRGESRPRRSAVRRAARKATVETLEPRQMLSVTATISGSSHFTESSTPFVLTLTGSNTTGTKNGWSINWGDNSVTNASSAATSSTHVYTDGHDTISATFSDTEGGVVMSSTSTLSVTVDEAFGNPSLTLSACGSVAEGSAYTMFPTFSEPGGEHATGFAVWWGDTVSSTPYTAGQTALTHCYIEPGCYGVTVVAYDSDYTGGSSGCSAAFTTANISEANPNLSVWGPSSVIEGSLYGLTANFFDPGCDAVSTYVAWWGDGSSDSATSGGLASLMHSYAESCSTNYAVTLVAFDEDHSAGLSSYCGAGAYSASTSVKVNEATPTLLASGGTVASITEGSTYTLHPVFSDPGKDALSTVYVNWGDGSASSYPGTLSNIIHNYANEPGQYAVTFQAFDEDEPYPGTYGTSAYTASVTLTVNEAAQSDWISLPSSIYPRNTYNYTVGISDPGGDLATYTIDWGDGTTSSTTVAGTSAVFAHSYTSNSNYNMTVTAVDEDSAYNGHFVAVVSDVPMANAYGDNGGGSVVEGSSYKLQATFNDLAGHIASSWVINWGDGQADTENTSAGPFYHTYTEANNSYLIQASAYDVDGVTTINVNATIVEGTAVAAVWGASTAYESSTPNYTLNFGFTDPEDSASSWWVDWGDGTPAVVYGGAPSIAAHGYAEPGTYHPKFIALDEDHSTIASNGSDGSYSAVTTVTISEASGAQAGLAGTSTVTEGSQYDLTIGFTDPGGDMPTDYKVNWGDGGGVQDYPNPITNTFSHIYYEESNNYSITASAVTEDGTFSSSHAVAVSAVPPLLEISGATSTAEGNDYHLNLWAAYPGDPDGETAASLTWTIQWGDQQPPSVYTGAEAIAGGADHVYKTPGHYAIVATASDNDGTWGPVVLNGQLDVGFGPNNNGIVTTDFNSGVDSGRSIALQPDGQGSFKIIAAGATVSGTSTQLALARYDSSGRLDGSFANGGTLVTQFGGTQAGSGLVVLSDGSFVVAGGTSSGGFALARYYPDGTAYSSFGNNGIATTAFGGTGSGAAALALQDTPTGTRLLVAGTVNGNFEVAAYTSSGQLDTSFGGSGTIAIDFGGLDTVGGLTVDGAMILVSGTSNGKFALARYTAAGTYDPSFGIQGKVVTPLANASVSGVSVAVQSDGKVLLAGTDSTNSTSSFVLIRYNTDGSPDPSFNNASGEVFTSFDASAVANAIALETDSGGNTTSIIVAGRSGNQIVLAAYDLLGNPDTTFGIGGKLHTAIGSSSSASALLVQPDGKILLVGNSQGNLLVMSASDLALTRYEEQNTLDVLPAVNQLAATPVSASQINLSWTLNANNASAIEIDRSTDGTTFTPRATIGGTATTYQDLGGGLMEGAHYWYEVRAIQPGGASTFTPPFDTWTLPAAPMVLQIQTGAVSSTEVDLTWTNVAANSDGVAIEVSTDGTHFFRIDTAAATATSYAVSDLYPLTQYWFAVAATDLHGVSPLSNIVSATTLQGQTVNTPPTAKDVTYSLVHDRSLDGSQTTLVSFGDDSDGDSLAAVPFTGPTAHGMVQIAADGTFTYVPAPGFQGTDSFTYQLYDGTYVSNVATATLLVTNSAPVANDAAYDVAWNTPLTVSDIQGGLAGHSSDPDGDSLAFAIPTQPRYGLLAPHPDGTFTYTPPQGFVGTDWFQYTAFDGIATSAPATVTINVNDDAPTAHNLGYVAHAGGVLAVPAADGLLSSASDLNGDVLAVDVSQPAHGSLTFDSSTGAFAYTPNLGYSGSDAFTYTVSDSHLSVTATATIDVQDSAPRGAPDSYDTRPGTALVVSTGGVLSNDSDPDGDPLTAISVTSPSHGTISSFNASDGTFTYTPNDGFIGQDAFTYTPSDGTLNGNPVTVTIDVGGAAPDAIAHTYATTTGGSIIVDALHGLLAHAVDPQGGPLTAAVVTDPANGSLSYTADGQFTYTPDAGFTGVDSFTYQASDGTLSSNIATVSIYVGERAIIAAPDAYDVTHDRALIISSALGVLANDTDTAPGTSLTATKITDPVHGTLTLDPTGSFTYTPAAHFVGVDSFTYRVSDGVAPAQYVVVTLNVKNATPIAANDNYMVDEGAVLNATVSVLANDSDPEGDSLAAVIVRAPDNGTLTLNPNGTFVYTPDAGFSGADTFVYAAGDGVDQADATVIVTVSPVAHAPTATATSFDVHVNHALQAPAGSLLQNATSPDGNVIYAVPGTQPSHGTLTALNADGSFSYTPNSGYQGSDSFTYTVSDGTLHSASVTVTLTIADAAPTAGSPSYAVHSGGAISISAAGGLLASATGPDGDPLTAALVTGGALPNSDGSYNTSHGRVAIGSDGSVTYTPAAGFSGDDSFQYVVGDGFATSAPATVTLHVSSSSILANDDSYSIVHGQTLIVGQALGILYNDWSTTGAALTAVIDSQPGVGLLSLGTDGSFVYTAPVNFTGQTTFQYHATDGTEVSRTATVTLTVTDQTPVAKDDTYRVLHDQTLSVSGATGILANDYDSDGDPLLVSLVSGPSNGTLSGNSLGAGGAFSYTPLAGFTGTDSFVYHVSDGTTNGADATVTITVYDDPPVAVSQSYKTHQGRNLNIDLLPQDYDPNGDALVASAVGPVPPGLVLNNNGTFAYQPPAGFVGLVAFTYKLNDGALNSNTATVTINVTDNAPLTNNQSFHTHVGVALTGSVAAAIIDPEQDPVTIRQIGGVSNGSLSLDEHGAFTYTPDPHFVGTATFLYVANDGALDSPPTLVTIEVRNAAPHAIADSYKVVLGQTLTGNVKSNDFDPDGDMLTVTKVSGPSHGNLSLNSDGSFTYTCTDSSAAQDSFVYRLSDGTASSYATATITISAIPPHAVNDVYITRRGVAVSGGNVLTNDLRGDGASQTIALVSGPQHAAQSNGFQLRADGTFDYTPDPAFTGADTFTYRLVDNRGLSSQATVTIAVLNGYLVANDDYFSVEYPGPLSGNVLTNDSTDGTPSVATVNGHSLTGESFPINTDHGHVTSMGTDGSFSYTPNPGFIGDDSFTYTATSNGLTASATVNIHVTSTAPVANNDSLYVTENQSVQVPLSLLLGNDTGAIVASTFYASNALHGSVSVSDGQLTYTPNANFRGTDFFTYSVANALDLISNTATVTLTVASAAGAYYAAYDSAVCSEDAPVTIPVLLNDVDSNGDAVPADTTITVIQQSGQEVYGSAAVSSGSVIYTPNANLKLHDVAVDSFTYQITSPSGATSQATVQVSIYPVSHAIMVRNDSLTVAQDGFAGLNVLANDSDPDSTDGQLRPRYIHIAQQPQHGFVEVSNTGYIFYTPDPGYSGTDSFVYTPYSGAWFSGNGTVSITVTPAATVTPTIGPDFTPTSPSVTVLNPGQAVNWSDATHSLTVSNAGAGRITLNGIGAGGVGLSSPDPDAVLSVYVTGTTTGAAWTFTTGWTGPANNSLAIVAGGANQNPSNVVGNLGGITITGDLSVQVDGDVTAPIQGRNVTANASGSLADVTATQDIVTVQTGHGNIANVTAINGQIGYVDAGRSIIGNVTAHTGIREVHARVSIFGSVAANGGDIFSVNADNRIASSRIYASGKIDFIVANAGITSNITTGGDLNTVIAYDGDVTGSITVGGDLNDHGVDPDFKVQGDLKATLHVTGTIRYINAFGNISGDVTGGTVGSVYCGMDFSGNLHTDGTLDDLSAGRDFTGSVTAQSDIRIGVSAGRILSGKVVSQAGEIYSIAAGTSGTFFDTGIQGADIEAPTIGTVSSEAGLGHGGNLTGGIKAGAGGIGAVSAGGAEGANITSGGAIGYVVAGQNNPGDLVGTIKSTGGGIGFVGDPKGNITATISASGDIGDGVVNIGSGVKASGDISGTITAGRALQGVIAGGSISGALKSKTGSIAGVTAGKDITAIISAQTDVGAVTAGENIGGSITSVAGNIGDVTAGNNSHTPGNLSATITAAGNIGAISAIGSANANVGYDPVAGTSPNAATVNMNATGDSPVPVLSRLAAVAGGTGGNISGTIKAGGNIIAVTAQGSISKSISAGGLLGTVFAVGDISGNLTSGVGALKADTWGNLAGNITAKGDVVVEAFGNISGASGAPGTSVTSSAGHVTATSWGNLGASLTGPQGVTAWSAGNLSSSIAASAGPVTQVAWSTLSSHVTVAGGGVQTIAVGAIANAVIIGQGTNATLAWGDITNTPITTLLGTATVNSLGSIVTPITAPKGVMVVARNYQGTITAGNNVRLNLLNDLGAGSIINAGGFVTIVASNINGTINGSSVQIDAYGDNNAIVNASALVHIDATGSITGAVTSATKVDLFAENAISGAVTAQTGATLYAWGSVSGNVDCAAGPIEEKAYKGISGTITGHQDVTITSWQGESATVIAYGTATIFAQGDVGGTITAGNNVAVQSFGSVTATITAGSGAGGVGPHGAIVIAQANISGNVTSSDSIVATAGGNVSGKITATAGYATVDAAGSVTQDITAAGPVEVHANQVGQSGGSGGGMHITSSASGVDVVALGSTAVTISAATSASVQAGSDAAADVTLTAPGGTVAIIGVNGVSSATVHAPSSSVAIVAGPAGAAVEVLGSPLSAQVSTAGDFEGTVNAQNLISVSARGDVDATFTTTGPGSELDLYSGGQMDATATAAGSLNVAAAQDVTGTYTSGTAGVPLGGNLTITSATSVDGEINGQDAVTISAGTAVGGTITSTNGLADVIAGTTLSANVTGQSVSAQALLGDVSGTITAQNTTAFVFAGGNISNTVTATTEADVSAGGDISGDVTAGTSVNAAAHGAVGGHITAGADANVTAGSFGGHVNATGNATVFSNAQIGGTIDAGRSASVSALDAVSATITAALSASVFSTTNISGNVTVAGGWAVLTAGGAISGNVQAALTIDASAQGAISGTLNAGTDVTVSSFANISGQINAGHDANVTVAGDLTGPVQATRNANVTLSGTLSGAITAGQDANLYVLGNVAATVNATNNASVNTQGNVTQNVTAGVDAAVQAWGDFSARITAGNDVSLTANSISNASVQSGNNASIQSLGAATIDVNAGGTGAVGAMGALQAQVTAAFDILVAGEGDVDLTAHSIGGNVVAQALGALSGTARSDNGSVDATSLGHASIDLTAGQDAVLETEGTYAGNITAGRVAVILAAGESVDGIISGSQGVEVLTLGSLSGSVTASSGPVSVLTGSASTYSLQAAGDLSAVSLGNLTIFANSTGGTATVLSGGILGGSVQAGGNVVLSSLGSLTASVTAGYDAYLSSTAQIGASVVAGHDLTAVAYGGIVEGTAQSMTAGHDIPNLWSRGDLIGSFTAAHHIGSVQAYGSINATLAAPAGPQASDPASGTIDQVVAWGSIGGSITAGTNIGTVRSGKAVTATISPAPSTLVANDHTVFGPYPATPSFSLAAAYAQLQDARNNIQRDLAVAAQIRVADNAALNASRAGAQIAAAQARSDLQDAAQFNQAQIQSTRFAVGQVFTSQDDALAQAKAAVQASLQDSSATLAADAARRDNVLSVALSGTQAAIAATQADVQASLAADRAADQVLLDAMAGLFTIQKQKLAAGVAAHPAQWRTAANSMMNLVAGNQAYNNSHWIGGYSIDDLLQIHEAFELGVDQGAANALNGLQDAVIGLGNLAIMTSPTYWVARAIGYKIEIPSPDWSKGLFVSESDGAHKLSKFLGGQGLFILLTSGASLAGQAGEGAIGVRLGLAVEEEGISVEEGLRRVAELRRSLSISGSKNIAVADIEINGASRSVAATSGKFTPPGTLEMPAQRIFVTQDVGGFSRSLDSEVFILEHAASGLDASASGTIRLFSERAICPSCQSVIAQFRAAFPNIRLIITSGGIGG